MRRVDHLAIRLIGLRADREVAAELVGVFSASDEREVALLNSALLEELLERVKGRLIARDDEQARGVAVEAVDDAGALCPIGHRQGTEEMLGRVHEGLSTHDLFGRMYEQAAGLVQDGEVLIRVNDADAEGEVLLLRVGLFELNAQALPTAHAYIRAHDALLVDLDAALAHELLQL